MRARPAAELVTSLRARRTLGLAGLGAAVLLLAFSLAQSSARDARALPSAPALRVIEAVCSAAPERANERARAAEADARQRMDRYPFAPAEAPAALRALGEAASCYATSGDTLAHARVNEWIRAWRARVERDYRAHVLRYRLELASGRDQHRDQDERFLLDLLATDSSTFSQALRHARALRSAARED